MPRFLFACDSFKGTLSSARTAELLAEAAERHFPGCGWVAVPMADGGEGTVDAVVAATGGEVVTARVAGPLGDPVQAAYGMLPDGGAVIEMAAASGLPLVAGREDVLAASTLGTGQLVSDALDCGARGVALAIGGSATNDGGSGFLVALGARLLDARGEGLAPCAANLGRVAAVDLSGLDPRLAAAGLTVMCDVDNPLLGEQGATRVFGPQKGADPEMIRQMDGWLEHFAALSQEKYPAADPLRPGTGAAGGLGFAFLGFTKAVLESGVKIVLDETKLEDYVRDADLVITGEGRLDGQTVMGKAPIGVAKTAKKYGKPVIGFSGCVTKDAVACNREGIDAFFPILRGVVTLDEAMKTENAGANLADTAEQVFRLIRAMA